VVTAREQVQTLAPALEHHRQMESMEQQRNELNELQTGVTSYCEMRRMSLLKERIVALTIEANGLEGETAQCQEVLNNQTRVLRDLEREHRELGGDQIEQWEEDKRRLEGQRDDRLRKRNQAATACSMLGWTLNETPQGFAELVGAAREEIESWESRSNATHDEQLLLAGKKAETENAFLTASKEVKALQRQPSNIPADMLELRSEIATAIGISEMALPFAGELIEVKPEETAWQGAIERVLRGFALSLLVDERHYSALSNHINSTHLGQRLFYYRTGHLQSSQAKLVNTDSMVLKLNIKEGNYAEWLKAELRQRFDYACVDSVQAFRTADRAL